jgi:hypothetical protein
LKIVLAEVKATLILDNFLHPKIEKLYNRQKELWCPTLPPHANILNLYGSLLLLTNMTITLTFKVIRPTASGLEQSNYYKAYLWLSSPFVLIPTCMIFNRTAHRWDQHIKSLSTCEVLSLHFLQSWHRVQAETIYLFTAASLMQTTIL